MFGVSSSSRLLWMVQLDRVCVRGVWVLRFVRHSAKRCKGAGSVCILIDKACQVGSEYSLAAWGGGGLVIRWWFLVAGVSWSIGGRGGRPAEGWVCAGACVTGRHVVAFYYGKMIGTGCGRRCGRLPGLSCLFI